MTEPNEVPTEVVAPEEAVPAARIPSLADIAASQGATLAPAAAPAEPEAPAVALSPEDQRRAQEIARTIDFTKAGIESTYARDAQRSLSDFADNVLAHTSNKATGEAGELLRELLAEVEGAELSGIKEIPIIGKVVVGIDKLRRTYQKVAPQVDEVVEKLERAQAQMVADIAMYDTMYERNVEQYRALKVYIAAGKDALARFRADALPALEAEAASSGDAMGAQVLKDFKDKLDRFEKRLDDLDRVSVVSLQLAPQIKLLQNADKSISEKIDTTISTTIPLWKSQMVIALGLANQRAALDLQKSVDDTTNKLLRANAEALQQGAVAAEEATQRGSVDIETLEEVNQRLIDTLHETIRIQQEGRAARADAEGRMRRIESDLKAALLEQAGTLS
ncbi:toxic anion resistance protein [Collinsella intestinalis]|uniref:toxic anion resistance protein n=1 Tax=Collinsella intestinalis TaxID=147207 RepID=UPI0025A3CB6D|nr:toxic anion resistance protein [Collinsella intestinalis]MDM8162801.1 toxic anion resistance protein [Collinsella intestinalis]